MINHLHILRSCQPARLLKVLAKIFFLYKNSSAQWERVTVVRLTLIVTGRNSKHEIVYESLFKLSCDKSYLGLLPSSQCLLRQKPFQLTGTSFRLLTNF